MTQCVNLCMTQNLGATLLKIGVYDTKMYDTKCKTFFLTCYEQGEDDNKLANLQKRTFWLIVKILRKAAKLTSISSSPMMIAHGPNR